MSIERWYVFKIPGNRFYMCSKNLPINANKVTAHFSAQAAEDYKDGLNRIQTVKDNSMRTAKYPQGKLAL